MTGLHEHQKAGFLFSKFFQFVDFLLLLLLLLLLVLLYKCVNSLLVMQIHFFVMLHAIESRFLATNIYCVFTCSRCLCGPLQAGFLLSKLFQFVDFLLLLLLLLLLLCKCVYSLCFVMLHAILSRFLSANICCVFTCSSRCLCD